MSKKDKSYYTLGKGERREEKGERRKPKREKSEQGKGRSLAGSRKPGDGVPETDDI
jgi:hypothetical protein